MTILTRKLVKQRKSPLVRGPVPGRHPRLFNAQIVLQSPPSPRSPMMRSHKPTAKPAMMLSEQLLGRQAKLQTAPKTLDREMIVTMIGNNVLPLDGRSV